MKNINNLLRKNRRIMRELSPDGKVKVKKQTLQAKGFSFKYFTNTYKTKEGKIYYFCYEYGYLLLDNDFILLIIADESRQNSGYLIVIFPLKIEEPSLIR